MAQPPKTENQRGRWGLDIVCGVGCFGLPQSQGTGGGASWKRPRMQPLPGRVTAAQPRRGEEHVDRPSWAHVVLGSRDHLGERTGNAALPGPIQDRCQVGLLSYLSFFGCINDACYRRNPTSFIFPSVLCSLQDLSSLTRVKTLIPCRESTQS